MFSALFTPEFFSRLETLRIRTRRRFLGSRPGSHLSLRRGAGIEFADYRHYTPGDDLRYIDWTLYGRTDRFYVKLFQEEEELYTYLFLDASASMAYPAQDQKFARACDITLALAYVVLARADAVKLHLLTNEDKPLSTPFLRGRNRFLRLSDFLEPARPQGALDFTAALVRHLESVHRPGKAILVSDFLFPPEVFLKGLNLLRGSNLDLTMIQVLGQDEVDPPLFAAGAQMVDSESGETLTVRFDARAKKEYQQRLDLHNREIQSLCHQAGIHYVPFVTGQEVQDFVLQKLPALGLLM